MSQPAALGELVRQYPLSSAWAAPVLFSETADIHGVSLKLAGLSSEHASGRSIVGSAVDSRRSPLERSYFELLERSAVIEALHQADGDHDVLDLSAGCVGTCSHQRVFPLDPEPEKWRHSLSNGVAAHRDWKRAAERAALELIERDHILRSWYGEITPERVSMDGLAPTQLLSLYDFEACAFHGPPYSEFHQAQTVAVFGFPKRAEAPLLMGCAARLTSNGALAAAFRECLQRLGFLWREPLPHSEPQFSPTADFHQEHYLYPPNHPKLRNWLDGGHKLGLLRWSFPTSDAKIRFVDLTPSALKGRIFVVRAICDQALPLVFAEGHPWCDAVLPEFMRVHPIA